MSDLSQNRMSVEDMTAEITVMTQVFRDVMGQDGDLIRQRHLVIEEGIELLQAAEVVLADLTTENMSAFLKEVGGFTFVLVSMLDILSDLGEPSDPEVQAQIETVMDETIRTVVLLCQGFLTQSSFFLTNEVVFEVTKRIHDSNMSKLDDDGRPIKDDLGKVMKGPNYMPPYLDDLAERAIEVVKASQLEVETV